MNLPNLIIKYSSWIFLVTKFIMDLPPKPTKLNVIFLLLSLSISFFFFVFFLLILWAWLVLRLSLVFVWDYFKWLWIFVQNPEWFIEELFFRGSLLFSIKFENVTNKKMNKKRLNHLRSFFGRLQQRESRSWSYWHWWA